MAEHTTSNQDKNQAMLDLVNIQFKKNDIVIEITKLKRYMKIDWHKIWLIFVHPNITNLTNIMTQRNGTMKIHKRKHLNNGDVIFIVCK